MNRDRGAGNGRVIIKTALQRATAYLRPVSDTPELDAGLLLAFVLGKPRSYLFGHPDDVLARTERDRYDALVRRRREGVPVAYLTGHKGFWSLELSVCDAVLVPRPETETLVEAALTRIPRNEPVEIADLGTGSGAIALAIACERPDCRIVATELEAGALAVARDNARGLGLPNVEFRQGDWFAPLADEHFGMLVSNPPYVAEDDPHLADLRHEPQAALVAEGNGLRCLRHLIENAATHLDAGGWLLLEHGSEQDYFVRRLMHTAGFLDVATEPDLAGLPRVTLGRLAERAA